VVHLQEHTSIHVRPTFADVRPVQAASLVSILSMRSGKEGGRLMSEHDVW
jgi:hypothetical protein